MKRNIKVFNKTIIIIIIIIIIILSGCSGKKDSKDELKTKVVQELNYIDDQIVTILNKLNNISLENYMIMSSQTKLEQQSNGGETSGKEQSSGDSEQGSSNNQESKSNTTTTTQLQPQTVLQSVKKEIDWETIENNIEIVNSSWGIILLDLYSVYINDTDILDFSNILNLSIISIKNKNKQETLKNLAVLYSYIPKYLNQVEENSGGQKVKQTKSYLINAYSLIEQGDWNQINNNITECDNSFKNIINDIEYTKNREYKINKTYILIKELQNSLNNKDADVFYIKYKNLLQSINSL